MKKWYPTLPWRTRDALAQVRAGPHARLAEGEDVRVLAHQGLNQGHLRRVPAALRARGVAVQQS